MGATTISIIAVWITVAWVILVSYPKIANAGPASFAVCVTQAAGPVCAAGAATATAACAATAWLPPLFCACVSGLMVAACGTTVAVCVGAFFAPTP